MRARVSIPLALAAFYAATMLNAEALPMARTIPSEQVSDIVQARQGCGTGRRRDRTGRCVRDDRATIRWNSRTGWNRSPPRCRYRDTPQGRTRVCR